MKISFVIDDIEHLDPVWDSTLRIMRECFDRGHDLSFLYTRNFSIRANEVCGYAARVLSMDLGEPDAFFETLRVEREMIPLAEQDVIFLRKNPPIDLTMINFLDLIKAHVFIVNDIDGLRRANNKLYLSAFDDPAADPIIPKTYVSKNLSFLKRVIQGYEEENMVLKPYSGFGGRGVIILSKSAPRNINSLFEYYTRPNPEAPGTNYVILQEYVREAEAGDTRILLLRGEILGAMRRLPAADDARGNIHAGGSAVACEVTESQQAICARIYQKLLADGLYFVGLDVAGDKLLEVNVVSPGGITRVNQLYGLKIEEQIVDFLEIQAPAGP